MTEHGLVEHALVKHALASVRSALPGHGITDVELLAQVEGERVVFRCRAGGTQVLVRCVERDVAHRQFRYLEALSAARSSVLRVPAPIAIAALDAGHVGDPVWAVLVLEHLEGTACTHLVERSSAAVAQRAGLAAMTLAGRALAELHAIDLSSTPSGSHRLGGRRLVDVLDLTDAGDHLTDLVRPCPDVLAAAVPAWAGVIERAVHHVMSAPTVGRTGASGMSGAPGVTPAVVHRDVHLRQMFVHDDRLGLVDWDLAAIGDPAFDVAYLVTHLATHVDRPDALLRAVLDGYDDRTMSPERLAPFRSFNLLRRACRRFRVRDAGWEAEMHRMLTMLADTLDQAGVAA